MKNFYRFSAPDDLGGEQVVESGPSTNHPTGRQRQTKQSRIKGEPQERNKPVVDDEEVKKINSMPHIWHLFCVLCWIKAIPVAYIESSI